MPHPRVVITGMSINTPIGDDLDGFLSNLLAGRSAITAWKTIDTSRIYAKLGGDLGGYDVRAKMESYAGRVPDDMFERLSSLVRRSPFSIGVSILAAVEAFRHAGLAHEIRGGNDIATIVAGHNLNQRLSFENHDVFNDEPDFIDGLLALHALDTDHVGSITEVLQLHGPAYTVGAACASGNVALRCAVDEIRGHGVPVAAVCGPLLDFAPIDLQGMAIMGAIAYRSFNDSPERASRPYDVRREGFVPSHGAAVLILEDLDHARARGAKIYAEILGVASSADGSHLPQPSQAGQSRLMRRLLDACRVAPADVDFISAHATSTPLGDLTELRSIKDVFGKHSESVKINAPKSLLGHTCWSAALVETVAAVMQMNSGRLHPSINIDELDPEVDLDVCRGVGQDHRIDLMLKNSFGFGGLNSISLIRRYDGA